MKCKWCGTAIVAFVLALLSVVTCFATLPPAIVLGIASLLHIRRSQEPLRGKGLAVASIVLCLGWVIGTFVLWAQDAEPIENDYTIADLRSAPADCADSFTLLRELTRRGPESIVRLTEEDAELLSDLCKRLMESSSAEVQEQLRTNEQRIRNMWDASEKAREIIHQLDAYPQVADLAEPDSPEAWNAVPLMLLMRLYVVFIHLEAQAGNYDAALDELLTFDSVIRKLLPNARELPTHLVCWMSMKMAIGAGNCLVNEPGVSERMLSRLMDHFVTIPDEEFSMRNAYLYEYSFWKHLIMEQMSERSGVRSLFLKRQSLLRLFKNHTDEMLSAENDGVEPVLSVWPTVYPIKPHAAFGREDMFVIYRIYNPTGARITRMVAPIGEQPIDMARCLGIYSDMLCIVINKRLGRPVDLTARAYSDSYVVDAEQRRISSCGPDGEVGTEDDIWLPIDPNVLEF